jgi:hypothetical protein
MPIAKPDIIFWQTRWKMAFTEMQVGDQVIRYDRDRTQRVYSSLDKGDADECGCIYCQNFAAQRDSVYPESFKQLLDQLGIDPAKEGEVYEVGPADEGKFTYGGWFYFTGEMITAGERTPSQTASNTGSPPNVLTLRLFVVNRRSRSSLSHLSTGSLPFIRNDRSAGRAPGLLCAEAGTRAAAPFPAPLSPLVALFLRYALDRFLLTKPNTSLTIELPASLRSDGVRDHPGTPFGFPPEQAFSFTGIPTKYESSFSIGSIPAGSH